MNASGAKILVVEDDFMNKVLVKEMLSLEGYVVLEASNGKEAIDIISAEKPDLILMDLNMPVMDGVTAARHIKKDEKFSSIPLLALTASAMKGDEQKILGEGFDGYVPKPIELKRLLDSVAEGLKNKTS